MNYSEKRLSKVLTRIYYAGKAAWFMSILMRLEVVWTARVPVMGTEGKRLYVNADGIENYTDAELGYILIHECLHIVCLHMVRGKGLAHRLFNIACDYAINPLINEVLETGVIEQPEDALIDARFFRTVRDAAAPGGQRTECMDAESIYKLLQRDQDEQEDEQENAKTNPAPGSSGESAESGESGESGESEGDGNITAPEEEADDQEDAGGSDDQSDDGDNLTDDPFGGVIQSDDPEIEQVARELIAAADAFSKGSGNAPYSIQKLLAEAMTPSKDWKEEMTDAVKTASDMSDYDRKTFNRRLIPFGHYAPGIVGEGLEYVVVAVDESGSMSDPAVNTAWQHVKKIFADLGVQELVLMHVDTDIRMPVETYFAGEQLPERLERKACGGTSLIPPFYEISRDGRQPDLMVYFSDMGTNQLPKADPGYPVLWVCDSQSVEYGWAATAMDFMGFGKLIVVPIQQ
jgi:predicted metal-dependent peptidase